MQPVPSNLARPPPFGGVHRDDLFFAAVAATRMPMVVTDPHGPDNPIVFVNEAFVAMSGYAADEVMGRNCRFLQGPETDRHAIAAIRDAIARHEEVSTEVLNYKKDGTTFWNALFITPVRDAHGHVVYYFASQFDVSRRRDAEEALDQAQKLEALGQLTGGIAHDFNNLLQVMLGHVDLLDRRLRGDPVDVSAAARASQSMRAAIGKASTLTQQLLAFARRQRLEGRLVDLNRSIEDLIALAGRTVGRDVRMVTDLAPDLGNCRIDPSQFEAALLSVLVNARDAMRGRGTVSIRTSIMEVGAHGDRSMAGLEPGRYAVVAVSDTGPGIAPNIVHRVMEPFFTTKDEGKGTGLGLSMVHGFAKQSGGGVYVDSQVGVGTTIRLCFPVAPGDADAVDPVRAPPCPDRGGAELILLVDDRSEVLSVARSLLEELGYRTLSASSGLEALQLVEALEAADWPALLFSDVIMPGGMNGFTLARKLCERMPNLRVLLTTGYVGDPSMTRAADVDEFDVLDKPYQLDEMARRVRGALDGPKVVHAVS